VQLGTKKFRSSTLTGHSIYFKLFSLAVLLTKISVLISIFSWYQAATGSSYDCNIGMRRVMSRSDADAAAPLAVKAAISGAPTSRCRRTAPKSSLTLHLPRFGPVIPYSLCVAVIDNNMSRCRSMKFVKEKIWSLSYKNMNMSPKFYSWEYYMDDLGDLLLWTIKGSGHPGAQKSCRSWAEIIRQHGGRGDPAT
jgi:hypothetical protein